MSYPVILPEGVPTRWQQAISRDNYMEWQSYAFYLRGLSRIAWADNSFCMASDLLFLAEVAYQRARDLEPVRADEYTEEQMGAAA